MALIRLANSFKRHRAFRQWRKIETAHFLWHFLPYGPVPHITHMLDGIIDNFMCKCLDGRPVLRVKRFLLPVGRVGMHGFKSSQRTPSDQFTPKTD
jgi:hypothetical protein